LKRICPQIARITQIEEKESLFFSPFPSRLEALLYLSFSPISNFKFQISDWKRRSEVSAAPQNLKFKIGNLKSSFLQESLK